MNGGFGRKTVVTVVLFLVMFVAPVAAQAETVSPVGVSLASPIQFPPEKASVAGVRLNVFYTRHHDVTGLDLGLGINRLDGSLRGLQFGLYNNVSRNTTGGQLGGVNVTEETLTGFQFGLMNLAHERLSGAQIGLTNKAHTMNGVQLGLVNTAFRLRGLQVGLLNMKQGPLEPFPTSMPYRIVPLVNWTF